MTNIKKNLLRCPRCLERTFSHGDHCTSCDYFPALSKSDELDRLPIPLELREMASEIQKKIDRIFLTGKPLTLKEA